MKITKIATGLILKDDFSNSFNPAWDFFPNSLDRVLFNEDSIVLLPQKSEPLEMLMPSPIDGKFIMQTELNYNPLSENDIAGCLIKSITGNTVDCEFTYEEGAQNNYKYLSLSSNENYIINLRASADGRNWHDLGNTKFYDGNYLGYFINGSDAELEIKNCVLCRDKFVVIRGINPTDTVKLIDSKNTDLIELAGLDYVLKGTKLIIDVSNILLPIKNVSLVINNVNVLNIDELYGGDAFDYDSNILFEIEGTEGFDLGEVYGKAKNYTLTVTNNSNNERVGKLVIDKVSSYDKGHCMAYLYDIDETDFTKKQKSLDMTISAGQTMKCIVRIDKDTSYVSLEDNFNFNILFVE